MQPKHLLVALLGLAVLIFSGCAARTSYAERADVPELPLFHQKVTEYTKLVDQFAKDLGKLPDKSDPERIVAHKRALADAIKKARAGARQGDIFVAAEQPVFRRIVRSEVKGRDGAAAKKTIAEDNPRAPAKPGENHNAPPVTLAVNASYPDGAPRSTVPPSLLLRMPKIPETVEFRFVGKALVLYDTRANLIVDFIPDALL
jgi:hypothetical protein